MAVAVTVGGVVAVPVGAGVGVAAGEVGTGLELHAGSTTMPIRRTLSRIASFVYCLIVTLDYI
jgi:hypothetical protein